MTPYYGLVGMGMCSNVWFLFQAHDTPLHIAARNNHVSVVDLLLARMKANARIKNKASLKLVRS